MFVQRCAVILFPLKRDRHGVLGFVRNTKKLIIGTTFVALITQVCIQSFESYTL
ncbi:hypothetical protein GCK32_021309 [Trichostrongylus colubriformis]|uniref:Uncharacterized protein n=1 Tax=Trichostrongylus colubriformis TaxID=6319 RepID=A0AAN8FP12_TRICO